MSIDLEDWIKAGKLSRKVIKNTVNLIKPRARILDICEYVERQITKHGAMPAFPTNVSINNIAAHYTSPPRDEALIPSKALVKLDIGVNINNALADTAITVVVGGGKLLERLVRANQIVLNKVIDLIKDGIRVKEISRKIWELSHEFGYGVIADLGGHELKRGVLHAGLFIPNHPKLAGRFNKRLRAGMIIAIEPFLVLGSYDSFTEAVSNQKYIYSVNDSISDEVLRNNKFLKHIYSKYGNLPFAIRWLGDFSSAKKQKTVRSLLETLERRGFLLGYPVLVDHKGQWVSQFEHTILVKRSSAELLTG